MWRALGDGLDLNPPLSHLLTKGFCAVFGYSEIAVRTPETLALLIFCLCGYVFVSRRCGKICGISTAVLISLSIGGKVAVRRARMD